MERRKRASRSERPGSSEAFWTTTRGHRSIYRPPPSIRPDVFPFAYTSAFDLRSRSAIPVIVGLITRKTFSESSGGPCGVAIRRYTTNTFTLYTHSYLPIQPPSTVITSPLTYPLPLLARNTTAPLKSSGLPHRPAGILSNILFALASSAISAVFISVAI